MIGTELKSMRYHGHERPGEFFEERHRLPRGRVIPEPTADADRRKERAEPNARD